MTTVEPPNNEQVGTLILVHYSEPEVVLYWVFFKLKLSKLYTDRIIEIVDSLKRNGLL